MKLPIKTIFRSYPYLFWMVALAALASPTASALNVRGEEVTQADISMLPPVCRFIMIERPGIHLKGGDGPLRDDAPLLDRPEYAMAQNNSHLHHYCWALVSKMRYLRATTTQQKKFQLSQFIGDIDYVLRKSRKDWQYFHVLLVDQAEMMKVNHDYPYSLLKIDEALKYKPDYERAYALKAKVYLAMEDKQKAIETALEGLEKIPRSKYLRWQLEKLGVKLPPPEPDTDNTKENTSNAVAERGNGSDASDENSPSTATIPFNAKKSGQREEAESSIHPVTNTAGENQDKPVTETDSQPGNNPYCRFCP